MTIASTNPLTIWISLEFSILSFTPLLLILQLLILEAQLMLTNPHDAFRGPSRSHSNIQYVRYSFLLCNSNFVPKMHRFCDSRLVSIQWPWNPGWGSLKVIENYAFQSGTYDFLLTFHSNHQPILHRFQDKRWFPSKVANFFHPRVFIFHAEGLLFEMGTGAMDQNTRTVGLQDGRKCFKLGLAVLIQYRHMSSSQPFTQPATLP